MKQTTNNPPDKSPVDDLFARRLGQHSLSPDKAGWERLQAKMAGKQETRVLAFWQNPSVHRYAAAACVSVLVLAGGWLLLRPTDGVLTRQNQIATAGTGQKTRPVIAPKHGPDRPGNRVIDQSLTAKHSEIQQGVIRQSPINATSNFAEKTIAQTKRSANQSVHTTKPIDQYPHSQVAKTETTTAQISPITVPTKPIAEQVLVVTIAEPDALIEARQVANWSESDEKTLVVDVSPKPTKSRKLLQQVARVRNGDGIELAGDADQGLLSRAFQTIKNKANNKPIKQ